MIQGFELYNNHFLSFDFFHLFKYVLFHVILYFTVVQKKRKKNHKDREKKKRNLILMITVHKLEHHLLPSPLHNLSKYTDKLQKARILLPLKGFNCPAVQSQGMVVKIPKFCDLGKSWLSMDSKREACWLFFLCCCNLYFSTLWNEDL